MQETDYATTFTLEGHNWWFVGMRRICRELAARSRSSTGRFNADSISLDVGCGTGINLGEIAGQAVGVDTSMTALTFCRRRSLDRLVNADGTNLPFADGTVGRITAIGVIEHIEDDAGALREWARVLRPGGQLTLLTSAYAWMWSGHDVSNHHVRRYRRRDLEATLISAGFTPVQVSYVNTLLFPPIAIVRLVERLLRHGRAPSAHKNTAELPAVFNRLLIGVLAIEARLMKWGSLPFGVSIVASACAPGEGGLVDR